jgi:hypothetical protein
VILQRALLKLKKTELKRLYAQLHLQKLKSVIADNPHVATKRRPVRKNRRFSTAVFSKAWNKDFETPSIKTPEESVCSNDILSTSHATYLDDSSSQSTSNYGNVKSQHSVNGDRTHDNQSTNRVQFK